MKVKVRWIKSPRQIYGIPRAPGSISLVSMDLVRQIQKESPGFLEVLEEPKEKAPVVRDKMVHKASKTRKR